MMVHAYAHAGQTPEALNAPMGTGIGPGLYRMTARMVIDVVALPGLENGDGTGYLEGSDLDLTAQASAEPEQQAHADSFVFSKLVQVTGPELKVLCSSSNGAMASVNVYICAERIG